MQYVAASSLQVFLCFMTNELRLNWQNMDMVFIKDIVTVKPQHFES